MRIQLQAERRQLLTSNATARLPGLIWTSLKTIWYKASIFSHSPVNFRAHFCTCARTHLHVPACAACMNIDGRTTKAKFPTYIQLNTSQLYFFACMFAWCKTSYSFIYLHCDLCTRFSLTHTLVYQQTSFSSYQNVMCSVPTPSIFHYDTTLQYYATVLRYSTTLRYYTTVLRCGTTLRYHATVPQYGTALW